ncbi:ATP-binding protein [Amycolatopsis jejuensis]|uniref:ATP-binding protein n=1 Tax=Amycolatopsis jejuensis TaxID=330084 RepID=UPI0007C57750|nr:ATP-binding protein [Amycolatopsis jejuensis]
MANEQGRTGDGRPRTLDVRGTNASNVPAVRAWAAGALADLSRGRRLDVLLVLDELVTNAHVHTLGPTRLRLTELARPCLVIVEADDLSHVRPVVRRPAAGAPHGRGMQLVDRLAEAWGVHDNPDGKTVWARLRWPYPPGERSRPGGPDSARWSPL